MRKTDGSISIVLALTITMVLSFCMVLVESAREQTMLLKADIVFDACVNSVMAEYHQVLWETYDVLYVDASYQTSRPSYEFVKNRLQYYADENLKYDKQGWLALSYVGATLSKVALATDYQGADFYQKAIEATKIAGAISVIEEIASYMDVVEGDIEFGTGLDNSRMDISTQIEEVNGTEVIVKEAVWGEDEDGNLVVIEEAEKEVVNIENPMDNMKSGNFLLRTVAGEEASFSQKQIDLASAASHRTLATGNLSSDELQNTIIDRLLYTTYVQEHFGNYVNPAEDAPLSYEMEYLIAGKASDIQNMETVVARLLLLREADNYLNLLLNKMKTVEAHALAAAATSIVPWLEPVVYQAILIYWAYEMSIEELQTLFSGGEMPLCKSFFSKISMDISLNYEEYIYLLLLLENREKLTMRSIDLIEFFVRRKEEHFRMDGCIGVAVLEGALQDVYKKQYTITKTLQYY